MNEVEDFINRRWANTDAHWLDGNCYYFALILCHRFPYLDIYYDPSPGHFVAGFDGIFYDINGQYESSSLIKFETLEQEDKTWHDRLIEYCIK